MSESPPDALTQFPILLRWPVQWGDQDALGHVNNIIFLRWFESGRLEYLARIGIGDRPAPEKLASILAAVHCNFRLQITHPDHVWIGAKVARIGRTSIGMEHHIWSETHQALAADGEATVVTFDYQTNQSVPVPDDVRQAIEQLEGRTF